MIWLIIRVKEKIIMKKKYNKKKGRERFIRASLFDWSFGYSTNRWRIQYQVGQFSFLHTLPTSQKITNLSLPLGQFGFLYTLATSFSHKSCTYKLGQFNFIRTLAHQMFILQLTLHTYHIKTFIHTTRAIWVGASL